MHIKDLEQIYQVTLNPAAQHTLNLRAVSSPIFEFLRSRERVTRLRWSGRKQPVSAVGTVEDAAGWQDAAKAV